MLWEASFGFRSPNVTPTVGDIRSRDARKTDAGPEHQKVDVRHVAYLDQNVMDRSFE